jgi:aromatic ring-cleaving dioxygenase
MQDESNDLTHNAVWLGKKSRLSGPILRVAKVAHADANQVKPLVRSEADTL